ncbi:MAG TPA: hypothetical protein VGO93_29215 [Candidatus Xenobia bacterium]
MSYLLPSGSLFSLNQLRRWCPGGAVPAGRRRRDTASLRGRPAPTRAPASLAPERPPHRLGHESIQTTLLYAELSDATADAELRATV